MTKSNVPNPDKKARGLGAIAHRSDRPVGISSFSCTDNPERGLVAIARPLRRPILPTRGIYIRN